MLKSFTHIFLLWTVVGAISKIAFLLTYHSMMSEASCWEYALVIVNGLKLDVAIAAYLTILPTLLLVISLWYSGRVLHYIWKGYFILTTLLATTAYISNLGLYGYWGFPLDNTPLTYITTSPADAMASLTWWQMILTPISIIGITAAITYALPSLPKTQKKSNVQSLLWSIGMVILGASLFIPIRGGFGTGTNHTGTVYFSNNIRLNHAAVNPIFSFVESVSHSKEDFNTRYRFFDAKTADRLFSQLTMTTLRKDATRQDYNIILISLESFSDTVMHIKGVTPHLNAIAKEGVYFPHFYANSTRTDRALTCIHSGLPAQPAMTIMDLPQKSTALPSIARSLSNNGYTTAFYYGGDTNYSNMQSYFMGTGFQKIISDKDFPRQLRRCKWGVADEDVYERMLKDIRDDKSKKPFFRSIMTESSHEPFDVPDYHRLPDKGLNAFAYADECLGRFITRLKALPCWDNTIVIIVPDHLGVYPENIDNYQQWRYHIPLILTGGAMKHFTITEEQRQHVASQIDIPATILGMVGIEHEEFPFSKDLLDSNAPRFAFFTFPDAMGMINDDGFYLHDNTNAQDYGITELSHSAKAYLQKLYDYINTLSSSSLNSSFSANAMKAAKPSASASLGSSSSSSSNSSSASLGSSSSSSSNITPYESNNPCSGHGITPAPTHQ